MYYPAFEHPATDISKFSHAAGIFTMMLHSEKIVHFEPDNEVAFKDWLLAHDVRDIKSSSDNLSLANS